jgi:hypothetical protein
VIRSERLRVESADSLITDYRLVDGQVEMRSKATKRWRRLTADEVSRHMSLHTVLAQWLDTKLWRDGS